MVNRVEGQELGTKQTVNSIETVKSSNLKDRRRHNDDGKHQDKIARHSAMWARKKAANAELMDPAHRDPLNHYDNDKLKLAGYHPHSIKMLEQMNAMHKEHSGTSTPAEHLTPLELHLDSQKHD